MAKIDDSRWHIYVAATSGLMAVLAAIASFQASGFSSQMLQEKNNSILYQSKANKEWNNYLALDITRQISHKEVSLQQMDFKKQADELEAQGAQATSKFQKHFEQNSDMVTAGTFLEAAIALASMSILVKRRSVWLGSLVLAAIGGYFLLIGLI